MKLGESLQFGEEKQRLQSLEVGSGRVEKYQLFLLGIDDNF